MFIGAKVGASMGHAALGFLVGTLVGGGVGLALASFAYSEPKP
jgi:ABC-type nitrate/sulfonate/bicarbonate transport system permease component